VHSSISFRLNYRFGAFGCQWSRVISVLDGIEGKPTVGGDDDSMHKGFRGDVMAGMKREF
jgi:hypothetical protein